MKVMTEKELNLFFLDDGTHEHTFSCGQQVVPEWRYRREIDVLIQRVVDGLIPLAQYYVHDDEELDDVVAEVHANGLVLSAYQDENGAEMVRFAACPDTRLGDLVCWNELMPFTKLEPELDTILQLRIENYLGSAEDQRDGFTPLEHAIVYGYSLNNAITLYTRRVW
eukprot:m.245181 g.245181  ORF g.245181 m.245181 type:complete len:167 (-) comp26396_c0_seq1:2194-2694(-)